MGKHFELNVVLLKQVVCFSFVMMKWFTCATFPLLLWAWSVHNIE